MSKSSLGARFLVSVLIFKTSELFDESVLPVRQRIFRVVIEGGLSLVVVQLELFRGLFEVGSLSDKALGAGRHLLRAE